MKKFIAGTAIALGLGAAGMIGAGSASAAGFAIDPIGPDNDFSVGTASADVGDDNRGVAISVFQPASVTANGKSTGNTLIAIDGNATVNGASSDNNTVLTVGGDVDIKGNSSDNNVFSVGSDVKVGGNANATTTLALCGTSFSGQSDKVTVSAGSCG